MSEPEADKSFEALLEYLRQNRGFDFTGYKRPSLMRRVDRRMQMVSIQTFEDYLDYLEVHPEEFAYLFDTILINVTGFFRDAPPWEYLSQEIIPRILAAKKNSDPIRIWSAGCASGEETYSLAIAFAEAMGEEAFRERVKIYASDVDEAALTVARQGAYSASSSEPLSAERKERFFERSNSKLVFKSDLRRSIIFGRLDLLVCRNTLMYFNADTQGRILAGFHFALNNDGMLFLGRAELLFTHGDLFSPVDVKHRIFTKIPHANARERWTTTAQFGNSEAINHATRYFRLRDVALDASPVARLVLNANGQVALMTQKLRETFGLTHQDVGRPLQDLEISYRPIELRSLVDQAYADRRTISKSNVERRLPNGETEYYDVSVTPLADNNNGVLGAIVTFQDVTQYRNLQNEIQESNRKLETAYEELQSAHEELETTNEELQSTNEELQTTNEELQSSNEELETMNEELQSTNEELRTINDVLRQRTDDLDTANSFLESILSTLRASAVVLDQNSNILIWNRMAEETWGLRSDEVKGTSFFDLDMGLEVAKLRDPILTCLASGSSHETLMNARNRRGRPIRCHVTVNRQEGAQVKDRRIVILMEEIDE